MNGGPAPNRGAVHAESVAKGIQRQLCDGIGNVVPEAMEVTETEIDHLNIPLLGKL
jgi:hypothetical protein